MAVSVALRRAAARLSAGGVAPWGLRQNRSMSLLRSQPQRLQPRLAATLPRVQAAHRGFATGKDDGDKNHAGQAPSALAVQNALTVQEKTEWQKKWDNFKGAAFQSRIFEHYKEGAEKIDDFIEDSVRSGRSSERSVALRAVHSSRAALRRTTFSCVAFGR